MLEEFPWLTEDDVKSAKERAARDDEEAGAHVVIPRLLKPEDYEEKAFLDIRGQLVKKREEWSVDDDEYSANFYVLLAGGAWTKKFKDVVSDSAHAKARAHAHDFCKMFNWPKTKGFHFTAHGELGSNLLAREWCRRGHHYFKVWCDSGGAEDFAEPGLYPHTETLDFHDWVVDVDAGSHTFAKVQELTSYVPKLVGENRVVILRTQPVPRKGARSVTRKGGPTR